MRRLIFLSLLLFLVNPGNSFGQNRKADKRAAKQEKYIAMQNAKKERKKAKEERKAEKDAFKRYYSIQCKDVRKRLKKQRRKSKKKKGGSASPGKVKRRFTRKK